MNPNPNHHHLRHPTPPNQCFPITNPNRNFSPPPQDLPSALSALTNLIHLTERALSSAPLTDLVRTLDKHTDDDFSNCPYNPAHRLPASSLFTHYLTCPDSLEDLNHLLPSLRYPHSLDASRTEIVVPRAGVSEDEVCFSVDGCGDVFVNYFYKDCPGVVSLMQERDGEKRMLTVPRVLFMECKDFKSIVDDEVREFENGGFKLLVSEFWLGRCEVESWNDYPGACSLHVLKMLSNICTVNDVELKKWAIVNSPRYGVAIDKAMTDHIVFLLKLCLRPMAKEAYKLVKLQMELRVSKEIGESNSIGVSFDCEVMDQVLRWFVSQLTVLYGKASGKHFGINMLKNCVIKAGMRSLLFQLKEKPRQPQASDKSLETNHECEISNLGLDLSGKQGVESGMSGNLLHEILLSQVATSVAALYERMILERKIRGFRPPQRLPKHQIVAEHDYLINKAREERQKRPNYKSIVEHDGLIWQHSHNQETNRKKTKEELLAEERDYKRRRMSYRGKKMKRSTTEVMRGIIEEYMEEIKLAGGIGCLVKGSAEARSFPNEPVHVEVEYPNASSVKSSSFDISYKSGRQPDCINKPSHESENRSNSVQSLSSKNYKRQNSEAYGFVELFEGHRNSSRNRHDRDHVSSNINSGSQRGSEDRTYRKVYDKEMTKNRHESISVVNSRDWKSRSVSSTSTSNSMKPTVMNADEFESRHTGELYNFRNQSVSSDAFEDRYEPAFDDRYDPSNSRTAVDGDVG